MKPKCLTIISADGQDIEADQQRYPSATELLHLTEATAHQSKIKPKSRMNGSGEITVHKPIFRM